MKILVTGGAGFIGRHIVAALLRIGHEPVAAVRDPQTIARRFPGLRAMPIDMNRDTDPDVWSSRLVGIDAVVNCAGILQQRGGQSIWTIHRDAPKALFQACATAGIRRVVQISAIGIEASANTAFADSKRAGDEALMELQLEWVVLRPSLVYGSGSYGGTSLLRGLAGLPGIIPLIDGGTHPFRPIDVDDLAKTVVVALETDALVRSVQTPVGPDRLTQEDMLVLVRGWLDLPPARFLPLPGVAATALARIGDLFGSGPVNSTALRQLRHGNDRMIGNFSVAVGFPPRSMADALAQHPSTVQDRWHARLYFAPALIRLALVVVWIGSGLTGLLISPERVAGVLEGSPIPMALYPPLATATSLLDLALGAAIAIGRGGARLTILQMAIVAAYTLGLTALAPALWLDPLGGLLKNIPILVLLFLAWALAEDR